VETHKTVLGLLEPQFFQSSYLLLLWMKQLSGIVLPSNVNGGSARGLAHLHERASPCFSENIIAKHCHPSLFTCTVRSTATPSGVWEFWLFLKSFRTPSATCS